MFEHGLPTTCTIPLASHHHNTGVVQQKSSQITTSHANMEPAMQVKWASITHIRTHKGVPLLSLAMLRTMLAATQHSTIPQPLNTV